MDIKAMIAEYLDFLKENITFRQIEKGYEITTPFLDDNNDHIQIYVDDVDGNNIVLSDDGVTISNLISSGIRFTPSRKQLLYSTARAFGVEIINENLTIKTTVKEFAHKKHALLQAILKVGDISFAAQSRVASMFAEDVSEYFKENKIYNMQNLSVVGKTGLVHSYDFVLQGDEYFKERFCETMNKPSKSTIVNAIFGWQDILPQRPEDSKFYVFLNDDNNYSSKLEDALIEYEITPIKKSDMETGECLKYFKKTA